MKQTESNPTINLTEIAAEVAAEENVTLGPADSITVYIAPNATVDEARRQIRDWLKAHK